MIGQSYFPRAFALRRISISPDRSAHRRCGSSFGPAKAQSYFVFERALAAKASSVAVTGAQGAARIRYCRAVPVLNEKSAPLPAKVGLIESGPKNFAAWLWLGYAVRAGMA